MTEAHTYLIENGFGKRDKKILKDKSAKTKYRCTIVKRRSKKQCECEHIVYEPSNVNNQFIIQHNGRDHNHEDVDDSERSSQFSPELIDIINDCSKKRMTAKKIIEHIDDLKLKFNLFKSDKTPSISQLYYFQLVNWLSGVHKDRSFQRMRTKRLFWILCIAKKMNLPFSDFTLRLIGNCIGLEHICSDATYKLMWQGFPFLVMGTVDRAKKFHPLCFACTSNERQEDFEFLFRSIKSSVEKNFNGPFSPSILIADGAHSISVMQPEM